MGKIFPITFTLALGKYRIANNSVDHEYVLLDTELGDRCLVTGDQIGDSLDVLMDEMRGLSLTKTGRGIIELKESDAN